MCCYIKYVGDGGNIWFTPLSSMELNSSRFKLNFTVAIYHYTIFINCCGKFVSFEVTYR